MGGGMTWSERTDPRRWRMVGGQEVVQGQRMAKIMDIFTKAQAKRIQMLLSKYWTLGQGINILQKEYPGYQTRFKADQAKTIKRCIRMSNKQLDLKVGVCKHFPHILGGTIWQYELCG